MHARLITGSILSAAVVAIVAHGALAAGEPKNVSPFTQQAPRAGSYVRPLRTVAGEPKNGLPFTAAAVRPRVAIASTDSGSGFSWADAALGAVLGVSVSAAAAGATLLARRKVPRPA